MRKYYKGYKLVIKSAWEESSCLLVDIGLGDLEMTYITVYFKQHFDEDFHFNISFSVLITFESIFDMLFLAIFRNLGIQDGGS